MSKRMIAALIAALPTLGGASANERGEVLDAVALSGSPAISIYALSMHGLPAPYHIAGDRLVRRAGLAGRGSGSTWLHFFPVLTYDGNINGGAVGEAVTLDGFRFEIADAYRAVGGVLVGAAVSSGARIGVDGGTALEFDLGASAAWSPERSMSKTSMGGSACLHHMSADRATHLRGCLDVHRLEYDLGETRRAGAELGIGHVFASRTAFHEVGASLRRERDFVGAGPDQAILTARYTGAFTGGWTFSAVGGFGARIEERIVMRERFSVSAARVMAGRPTSLMIGLQRNRGGLFLGEVRNERVISLGIGRQMNDQFAIGFTASRTEAKHDFFEDTGFGLNLGLRF